MKPYRIEERDRITGNVLKFTDQGWDGPILTADEAQDRFARELRLHPGRYETDSPFRLVLVAPVEVDLRIHLDDEIDGVVCGAPIDGHWAVDVDIDGVTCLDCIAKYEGQAAERRAKIRNVVERKAAQRPAILDLPRVHPADDPTLTANQRAAGRIIAATGRRLRTLAEIDADNRAARAVTR